MNGSGHPIDDKYASTRTALKELPLGGLLLDRCPSSGNGLIKMVSWKMYQNGEQELHHLTGHRQKYHTDASLFQRKRFLSTRSLLLAVVGSGLGSI